MKSLKYRLKKHEVTLTNTDWNKYDDRLMKAVERGEVDKVAAVLSKKGIIPTKLDVEGRSAFHLSATRGHLDCLNLILGHSVDLTATDATGKNALHLASRNGQSLCVQKLLQHNCPVGNVDLQGRTALHDAVMAGCSSSVKLLCDSGASVNASDFDGRTPLVLATQMCHPHICQLLLERGADIAIRDKQNKTAVILGCEYACKDAVEVLLKSGADVTAVDGFGHDSFHYARHSKNQELVSLVKTYLDNVTKAKEAAKMEQKKRQHSVEMTEQAEANMRDLERQNESQQETLRKFHLEQRALMDKVNLLQQQLSQEKHTVESIHKEREQLKLLLSAKDREEGARAPETVKVQLRSHMGDYSGQSVIKGKDNFLVKQSHSLDSAQVLQSGLSHSLSRPLELAGRPGVTWDPVEEVEALRRELETVRRRQQTAEEEALRLQAALARKSQECQELAQSRETIQRQADRQVQELEEALGDVQKRMLDSEAKVKQLQAHVVAVKEHLGGQAADELRAQLHDVKAKYEGASAEVGRVRNHLKQSEKALEEYKSSEGQLAVEAERLGQELKALREERDELAGALLDMEALIKETQAQKVVPAEKFDNMKNLLSNAVDEKERQLAELREDYDRVLEEVAELHREMDNQPAQAGTGAIPLQEHERMRTTLEEQSSSLKRRLADVTAKSQALIRQVEESEEERETLQEQLEELNSRVEANFIPLKDHEEAKSALERAVEELEERLVEAAERNGQAEVQIQRLQTERVTLCESVTSLQSATVPSEKFQSEVGALNARNAELVKELEVLQKRFEEREKELGQVTAKNQSLKQSLNGEYVSREKHEQVNTELSNALEKAKAELSKLEKEGRESEEELQKVKEGSAELKEKLENVQVMIENDYVCLIDHEAIRVKLSNAVVEVECRAKEALASYQSAQDETVKLHQEMEAQKKELDTIQEAIQSKFVPLTAIEERENSYNTKLKDLTGKLSEMQEKYNQEKSEGERHKQEKEKLKVQMESVQQRMETGFVASEKHKEVEDEYRGKMEELSLRLVDLEQQYKDVTVQRAELEEQNALCNTDIQSLQQRLESESARLEHYEAEHRALRGTIHQAQDQCQKAREAQRGEAQRACALEKELQGCSGDQAVLLQQHAQAKEALEGQVAQLLASLRQEQETSAQRAKNVAALQLELLQATQALEELGGREDQLSQLNAEKQRLEEETVALGERLSALAEQCEVLHREVAQAREDKAGARVETEALQEKSDAMDREIRELKERYEESLSTIGEFQRRIQMSAEQTEVKDKKITELLTDVERLKQALNGLSQLAYASNAAPNKRQMQHVDTLQAQIKSLQQQLADAESQHREVVSIYRTHLLSAAQGHMDEDVQAALLQIIRMRQEFVC
ncbi:uveal autoantigen with coiled-coil domains and ankyrin repeats [Coregonus clupeaformis]|uniref:uveal autoantigen with coiled-coil domains and ankyrin repeats n=1 Tax=Coregonus clupeaformis TaxID=59861 RepID=UPI001BDFFBFA|nr:uveal autoantigen with coiled-coil domains and ankyrin repeats [Coregonus clupeaformis]